MLRSFRLGNHRSFYDEQELLLMPSYDKSKPVVPVTAIYGANASGKSNLLDGLRFMREAVVGSFGRWSTDEGVPREPFKLTSAARDEPSVFVVELVVESVRYTYGFTLDDCEIKEEWLYSYPENRRRLLFDRTGGKVRFGSTVRGTKVKREALEGMTRDNALLLTVAGQSRFEEFQPVYRWFARTLSFRMGNAVHPEHVVAERLAPFLEDETDRSRVLELIRAADLGIEDVRIEQRENPFSRLVRRMVAEESLEEAGALEPSAELKQPPAELEHELKFLHTAAGDEPFGIHEESQGTREWLTHLPAVLGALRDGAVLVVDEIDTSLHPLLTSRLIGLFRDERVNTGHAQLILTTHDTSLLGTMLDDDALSRDSVWFVQKERNGSSSLYALSDFKPRKEENYERRYLRGSYGAVPFVDAEEFAEAFGVTR